MEKYRAEGTDYSFVEQQLEKVGYGDRTEAIAGAVVALFAVLDGRGLDLADRKAAAQLFATLVERDGELGAKGGPRSVWKQFHLGSFQYGCTVRVKPDAYPADSPGSRHNGLTGVFVSAYAGRAYVQYHGRKDGSGHEHSPKVLEVLWKEEG